MSGLSTSLVNSAQQSKASEHIFKKDIAVAKKTLDIEKAQGKQTVDMIKKAGQFLDMKV